jgi:diketogulonate reductase-like aldo/keto reductase
MIDTWQGMEDLYKQERVKNIGVSNFNVDHFEAFINGDQDSITIF